MFSITLKLFITEQFCKTKGGHRVELFPQKPLEGFAVIEGDKDSYQSRLHQRLWLNKFAAANVPAYPASSITTFFLIDGRSDLADLLVNRSYYYRNM